MEHTKGIFSNQRKVVFGYSVALNTICGRKRIQKLFPEALIRQAKGALNALEHITG